MIHAILDQFHHQVIIGNAELMEPSQTGTGIHQIMEQHPAFRVEDLIDGKVGAVAFVYSCHQLIADLLKCFFAAVIIVYHPGRAASIRINNQLAAGFNRLQPVHFRFVMVKGQPDPRIVGQVGSYITFRQFNLPVLYILRMYKLDFVDQIQIA